MPIDIGNIPTGTPPSGAEQLQMRTAIGLGQSDAPTFLGQSLTGQSLTGTQATSLVNLATTWNTLGTPTALKLNVTNTLSNAAALLMDLQVGLVSKASITKGGQIASGFGYTYAQPQFCDSTFGVSSGFQITGNQGVAAYGGGNAIWGVDNGATIGMRLASHLPFGWTSSHALSNNPDVALFRDAPGILAQRVVGTPQAFRIYNSTDVGGTNYERGFIRYATGFLEIGYEALGTGGPKSVNITTAGDVYLTGTGVTSVVGFRTNGSLRAYFNSAGHLLFNTNNAYDIGATGGVSCPRNIFAAGTVHATGFSVAFQSNATGTGVALYDGNTGTSIKTNAGAGIILLGNALASTDFGRLQLGGTTSAFPAIKRNGAGIDIRLADDFGFAPINSLYQRFGTGTPEGVVTAPIGAVFHRTDGAAATTLYVKEFGVGPNGWVVVGSGGGGSAPVLTPNLQTGTGYTLVLADKGKDIVLTNAAAITLTLPSGLGAGFSCRIFQGGAGVVTFVGSAATVNSFGSLLSTQGIHAAVDVASHVTDTFTIAGNLQ